MSDAIFCKLRLSGESQLLEDCRRAHFSDGAFDFNSVVPMPPALQIDDSSSVQTGYAALYGDWTEPARYWTWKEAAANLGLQFPLDSRENLLRCIRSLDCADLYLAPARQYKENMEAFGHGTWYGWCKEHWGTKWNADDTRVDHIPEGLVVRFTCASTFAKPVAATLSMQWPALEIRVLYADEHRRRGRDYVLKAGREVARSTRNAADILQEVLA